VDENRAGLAYFIPPGFPVLLPAICSFISVRPGSQHLPLQGKDVREAQMWTKDHHSPYLADMRNSQIIPGLRKTFLLIQIGEVYHDR
jgi:hypothetical protein